MAACCGPGTAYRAGIGSRRRGLPRLRRTSRQPQSARMYRPACEVGHSPYPRGTHQRSRSVRARSGDRSQSSDGAKHEGVAIPFPPADRASQGQPAVRFDPENRTRPCAPRRSAPFRAWRGLTPLASGQIGPHRTASFQVDHPAASCAHSLDRYLRKRSRRRPVEARMKSKSKCGRVRVLSAGLRKLTD